MALPAPKISVREYLAGEELTDIRHEFADGEVFEMEAATLNHQRVLMNLAGELRNRLAQTGCSILPNPRTATAENGMYTYPDLVVVCGRIETWPINKNTIANPRIIIEVLSPSTEGYDRGKKFDLYCAFPSFVEYLTVAQHSPWILQHTLHEDGEWRQRRITGLEAVLRLSCVPVEIPLVEIYRDVQFDTA